MTQRWMILLSLSLFILMAAAFSSDVIGDTPPLSPLPHCPERCTPDYWKTHKEAEREWVRSAAE